MVLLASEIKLLMSSSPFNSQSAGVLAGNKETYLYMWMISLCKGLGEVEFPMFLRKEIRQKCAAEIPYRRWRCWLLLVFYLQQRESGTRWTNGNSLLLSSSFQITLEKSKTSKTDDTAVAGNASVESWPLPAAWFFLFFNPARLEMLDGENKIAGQA